MGSVALVALVTMVALNVACRDDEPSRVEALPDTLEAEDVMSEIATRVGRVTRRHAAREPHVAGMQPARSRGRRLALVAPSPSAVEYDVHVPKGAVLRVGTGVATDRAQGSQGGRRAVQFRVRIGGEVLWERLWDSQVKGRHQRHWVDDEIDLGRFAGRDIVVALETDTPAGATPADMPAWSRVQVVRRTAVSRQTSSRDTPNVVLLVVDTLRADRLGSYGANPTRTPNLDRLAATGMVFRNTWAQAPWTLPSVATILTGRYPRNHGVVGRSADFGRPAGLAPDEGEWAYLADAMPTIASLARLAGVSTFGVTSNLLVSKENNLARGFEAFVELPVSPMPVQWGRADAVHRAFADWLEVNSRRRFFAYLHYMEPHDPYVPAPGLRAHCPESASAEVCDGVVRNLARDVERGRAPLDDATVRYLESLYDGEIRAWDSSLPGLLGLLEQYEVRQRTILIVVADHGEEFGEHGHLGHRKQLYSESLSVPLVIAGPGVPAGVRSDLAELVDVLPTILGILTDVEPIGDLPGRNLLRGETRRVQTFAETRYGVLEGQQGALELQSVRRDRWAYLRAPAVAAQRLHDVKDDPAETRDVSSGHPEVCGDLGSALDDWVARSKPSESPARQGERLTDKLRALGYVE